MPSRSNRLHRRDFLKFSGLAGVSLAGAGYFSSATAKDSTSPNQRLDLGCIGTAHQAGYSIESVKHENIVAFCDIDDKYLDKVKKEFPKAETYNDFRKLLDHRGIDAVTIATPDHIHAPATMAALKAGKHVYCEKPLTHTVAEARLIAETAAKSKLATQMGTQIHAEDNYRRVVEVIQSGAIGTVNEVHCWAGRSWGGGDRPKETPPVPPYIHWDLWLGPAPQRPYHSTYLPENWRKWWDFGGGNIGDMACHHMDLPYWALGLRHPTTIEAFGPAVHPETCPLGLEVHYQFAARGDQPAISLNWYDGTKIPKQVHDVPIGDPKNLGHGGGSLFVGSKGMLLSNYDRYKLLPETDFMDFKPPAETIAKSIGHHREWLKACRDGNPTTCNFDYSGALTESVLLGNVAFRTGKKIEWNAQQLKATNCPEAAKFVSKDYRKGWELTT